MIVHRRIGSLLALAGAFGIFVAGCGPGNNAAVAPVTTTTTTTSSSTGTFAAVSSAPASVTTTAAAVSLPAVSGASNVGGSLMMSSTSGTVTAIVTVASSASTSGGPPVLLSSSSRRGAEAINGTPVTPQYYVGVTNTGNAPQTVNIPNLTLNVNVGAGQSTGLAHYDPTQPQNGWNQHCAFGNGQVNTNGNTTTFTPGGNNNAQFTIYPGATLWFAPYTYPSNSGAVPTAPPVAPTTAPTSAPPPSSLTGTYVGSAMQTTPQVQASQYIEFQLTQTGSSVSGTIAVLPASGNQNGFFGTLTGSVSGGTMTLNASPQYGGSCPATITATAMGSVISGTFNSPACTSGGNTQSASGGTFSGVLQTASFPALSGTYTGTINDAKNGAGTVSFAVTTPGTVFSGTATANWPSNPQAGGTSAFVGFVSSPTSATFALIGNNSGSSGGNNNNGQNCQPFGTLTLANNGASITGTYTNSNTSSTTNTTGSACNGTGTFSLSH
jgi:hypothetical protein